MDIIQVVKGDTGPNLRTTITRSDTGAAFIATGNTVRLRIRKKNTTTVISSILSDSTLSTPGSGILVFPLETFLTNNATDEGFYEAEVEFTLPDNKTMSAFELINLKVRNEFG